MVNSENKKDDLDFLLDSKNIQTYTRLIFKDDNFSYNGFFKSNSVLFVIIAFFTALTYYLNNLENKTDDVIIIIAISYIISLIIFITILAQIFSYNDKDVTTAKKISLSDNIINFFKRNILILLMISFLLYYSKYSWNIYNKYYITVVEMTFNQFLVFIMLLYYLLISKYVGLVLKF